jgi:hypothetical protein
MEKRIQVMLFQFLRLFKNTITFLLPRNSQFRIFRGFLFYSLVLFYFLPATGQYVNIGSIADKEIRENQLLGLFDSTQSLTVRPVLTSNKIKRKPFRFSLLPVTFIQQYNSHHPYGWNDGSMMPAKGYQTLFSAGLYSSLGPLEIQLSPELLYSSNPVFEGNVLYGSNTLKPYSKIFPGQSSVRLSNGALSIGLSTQNLWWGPGIHSSLLMSNNAPGFQHIFFQSRRPVSSFIGSFEWQIIAGKLFSDVNLVYENRSLTNLNLEDKPRFISAMVLSYHPKWVPGLFVGFTRAIQQYQEDMDIGSPGFLEKYIPVIVLAVQKKNVQNDENKKRDQLASFFLRWLLAKSKTEFYFEYGFNDYGINVRDYVMAPTHSAAYIAGLKKTFPLLNPLMKLEMGFELTQMSQSPDYLVRNAGNWYEHSQVQQGYTNNNQIMGAGAGFGSNVQTFSTTWVKGDRRLGFIFERVERDPLNHINKWIDLGIGILPQWSYRNITFSGKLQFIKSNNYAWEKDVNRFNLHSKLGMYFSF